MLLAFCELLIHIALWDLTKYAYKFPLFIANTSLENPNIGLILDMLYSNRINFLRQFFLNLWWKSWNNQKSINKVHLLSHMGCLKLRPREGITWSHMTSLCLPFIPVLNKIWMPIFTTGFQDPCSTSQLRKVMVVIYSISIIYKDKSYFKILGIEYSIKL